MDLSSNFGLTCVIGGTKSGKTHFVQNSLRDLSAEKKVILSNQDLLELKIEDTKFCLQKIEENYGTTVTCLVFDSLSLWLAAVLTRDFKTYSSSQIATHLNTLREHAVQTLFELSQKFHIFCVLSNTADGVVPSLNSARIFRESNALMCTQLALKAHQVYELKYGIVHILKQVLPIQANE